MSFDPCVSLETLITQDSCTSAYFKRTQICIDKRGYTAIQLAEKTLGMYSAHVKETLTNSVVYGSSTGRSRSNFVFKGEQPNTASEGEQKLELSKSR
jgi:hypothetical protein